ncbi:replication factor A1 [Geosmithia morbida]|uniref:Replication protein A subunit n=1 Tax=Geosmithia morbida TaxID=1094350 RepID=A0A9P4YSV7_9HYPO|nr:replication factor A1 [Geosmithia morbida]KAF4121108.1 replication factor A1 [Geosmithia morbida]
MEAASAALSRGALDAIFNDPEKAEKMFPVPVLQCLQVKQMAPSAQAGDRWRLVISDGEHYVQSMLATKANQVIHDGKLVRGSFARVKQYQPNNLKGRRHLHSILIILDLEVIEDYGVLDKIGEPVSMDAAPAGQVAGQAAGDNNNNNNNNNSGNAIAGNDFYGAKKEEPTQSKPSAVPAAKTVTHAGSTIHPIEALSFFTHKWTIKARVTLKSDIKRWQKANSEGKLFSVNLLDESGEIKATGFNDQCDAFYDLLQEGSVYYISTPCKVALAKKQFTNLPNDYELTFERDTVIEKADDQSSVPQMRFNFCTIQELQSVEKDSTVDVIGVLKDAGEVSEIISKKDGRPFQKRELTVVDDTGFSVRVTVWGKTATSFDANPESVVAFKGTKVSDFGGKSLSLLSSGTMSVDPDIPDAHRLKGWYDSAGRGDNFATHQNSASMAGATGRKDEITTIRKVKDDNLGHDEQAYFTIIATNVFTKQDSFSYPACPSQGCNNKKVTELGDGTWQCEKCNIAHEKPNHRYILSINVADFTNHMWLTCFDEAARVVMGVPANELMEMRESDDAAFQSAFEAATLQKFNFRCRARMDTYGNTPKIRYQVLSVSAVDYKSEGDRLAKLIEQYNME